MSDDGIAVNPSAAEPQLTLEYALPAKKLAVAGACAVLGACSAINLVGYVILSVQTYIYLAKLPSVYGGPVGTYAQLAEQLGSILGHASVCLGALPILRRRPVDAKLCRLGLFWMGCISLIRTSIVFYFQLQRHATLPASLLWENWTLYLRTAYEITLSLSYFVAEWVLGWLTRLG